MNIRSLLFVLILFAVYLCSFYFTQNPAVPHTREEPTTPTVILPTCKEQDVSLGINSEGYSYCKHENSIRLLLPEKEITVIDEKLLGEYDIVGIFDHYLASTKTNTIHIYSLDATSAVLLETYTLSKNETLVSIFGRKDGIVTTLYMSTVLEAKTPKDIKSKIYKLALTNNAQGNTKLEPIYSSIRMEKVVFVYPKNDVQAETLFTQESYVFLQPLKHIILAGTLLDICPISEFGQSIDIPYIQTAGCSKRIAGWYKLEGNMLQPSTYTQAQSTLLTNKNGILMHTQEAGFEWRQNDNKVRLPTPTEALRNIGTAFFVESTNIGKRVYNCIDFGDPPQLTLRVCIPNL